MKLHLRSRLLMLAALLSSLVIYGCGSSTKNSVSTTEETFYAHTVIFANTSTLYTSGYNGYGQIGNGTLDDRSYFYQVSTSTGMNRVHGFAAGANHTLAYSNISTVWAWGSNFQGRLGVGGTSSLSTSGSSAFVSSPEAITLPGRVKGVAAGWKHSLALVDIDRIESDGSETHVKGQVFAWGGNSVGQLGNNTTENFSYPTPVLTPDVNGGLKSMTGVVKIVAGGSHSLALTENGDVYSWGSNSYAQLGRSGTGYDTVAIRITNLPAGKTVKDIAAAGSYSLALMNDGSVYGWGYNGYAQIGAFSVPATPAAIKDQSGTELTGAEKVSAGTMHVLALKKRTSDGKGEVWGWGFNEKGQLGTGVASLYVAYPAQATSLNALIDASQHGVEDIYAFGNQSFARIDGVWYGWGDNGWGQLGQEVPKTSIAYKVSPVQLRGVPTP